MNTSIRFLLLFAGFCFVLPASAAAKDSVVCGVNQERVWVYSSLTSFDVAMKLKCGETVEIIGRVKGYVKIRAQSGLEGYVPDSAIPNLPPFVDPNDKVAAGNYPVQTLSSRSAVHPAAATSSSAVAPPKPVAAAPVTVAPPETKLAATISSAAPGDAPHTDTNTNADIHANATVNADANPPQPVSPAKSASSASKPKTKAVVVAKKGTGTSTGPSTHPPVTAPDVVLSTNPSNTSPRMEPAVASSARPVSNDLHAPSTAATRTVSASTDPDEDLDPPSFKAEDYSSCQVYFSAYGLSANQYRWFVQNRKKNHPSVCPAPAPALVDFVIIFTHDVDFFSYTMPTTFHTDKNGFSDFTPLVTINTPAMSQSDADKAHHEYVWVFHTTRGVFDPAKFSPHRHPLFTKSESNSFGSHAGDRTVEDALGFIEGHGATR